MYFTNVRTIVTCLHFANFTTKKTTPLQAGASDFVFNPFPAALGRLALHFFEVKKTPKSLKHKNLENNFSLICYFR